MKNIVLLILILFSANVFAQTFSGKVSNSKTNEVLPYANVGVRGRVLVVLRTKAGISKLTFQKPPQTIK